MVSLGLHNALLTYRASLGSLQEHKEKQKAHYEALKSRDTIDPDWAAIEEHWEALGGSENSLPNLKTSRGEPIQPLIPYHTASGR